MKIEATILKETRYIAVCTAIGSAAMQAVFCLIGQWSGRVLFGNLLGYAAAVLNFFLMGLTVQTAVTYEPTRMAQTVNISLIGRRLLLSAILIFGIILPYSHTVAVILPVFFPRIAIALRTRNRTR